MNTAKKMDFSALQQATQIQKEHIQVLSHKVGCTEIQAYVNSLYVLESLEVRVTDSLFTALVNLCYKVGVYEYTSTYVALMVNERYRKGDIMKLIQKRLSDRKKHCMPLNSPFIKVA